MPPLLRNCVCVMRRMRASGGLLVTMEVAASVRLPVGRIRMTYLTLTWSLAPKRVVVQPITVWCAVGMGSAIRRVARAFVPAGAHPVTGQAKSVTIVPAPSGGVAAFVSAHTLTAEWRVASVVDMVSVTMESMVLGSVNAKATSRELFVRSVVRGSEV